MIYFDKVIIMKKQIQGSIYLLAATIIWGSTFIAQSVGMDLIEPFTFQAVRCGLAVPFLAVVIFFFDQSKPGKVSYVRQWMNPKLWKTGLICGAALFVASGLQQIGLVYTSPGKAGFITAMYIVLVPILGLVFRRHPAPIVWLCVIIATVGLYLLSCVGVTEVNIGDLYLLLCALFFAVQITLIDRLAGELDGLRLNCIQALVCSVLSAVMMVLFESPDWGLVLDCWFPLCYAGILSMGVAYSLQILGQQKLDPTPASLIMSLESVFAALCGWLLLHETMTAWEFTGCALVFIAVILSQLPRNIFHKKTHS